MNRQGEGENTFSIINESKGNNALYIIIREFNKSSSRVYYWRDTFTTSEWHTNQLKSPIVLIPMMMRRKALEKSRKWEDTATTGDVISNKKQLTLIKMRKHN